MSIRPIGSSISAGGNTLFLLDVKEKPDYILFERQEFDHERQMNARHTDGTRSTFLDRIGGGRAQIAYGCGLGDTIKPIGPLDSSPDDLNNFYKRFNVTEYTLIGDTSTEAAVNAVKTIANTHRLLWAKYETRQKVATGPVSYEELKILQLESLSYLTTTGFSITGAAFTGSNLLIRDFTSSVDYEVPQASGSVIYKSWTMQVQSLTIANGLA